MRFLIDLVYLLAAAAYSPTLIYRVIRHKRYRTGWLQRFGRIERQNPSKKCIWLHAVSVGEVNAAKTVVEELENRFSDFEILMSTTTDTGFARATTIFGQRLKISYFPFDFSVIMRHAFRRIQPAICLLMEQEVWPNFLQIAQKQNIPVIVVNGRISDKSYARFKKIKPIAKMVFKKVTLILAQTEQYAQRFAAIGCPREKIIVTGSLKYDTAEISDKVEGADALASQLNLGNQKLWVTGATGNNEEKILLDVYQNLKLQGHLSDLRLVIVPRKPERFDEVAQLIQEKGFDLVRYSNIKKLTAESAKPAEKSVTNNKSSVNEVILGDTMGDLRKFYSLAAIIFVGRSLVPMGGSDMIEATALGKPTLFGPYAFNFRQTVDALLEDNGAIMVKDQQDLLQMMKKCLAQPEFAHSIARSGREVIRKNQGATAKTIDQIAKFLTT